ncbi:MAG: MBL fold metallo-hydrolase [Thermofilum sp.]
MSCDKVTIFFWGTGSTRPAKDRDPSCILVRACAEVYILDCGEGCQRAFEEFGVGYNERLTIIVSHLHGDHVLGLLPLLQTLSLAGRSKPVRVVGPLGLWRILSRRDFAVNFPLHVTELATESGELSLTGSTQGTSLVYTRALHVPLSYSFVIRFPQRIHLSAEKLEKEGVSPKLRSILIKEGIVHYGDKIFKLDNFIESIDPALVIAYSGDTLPNALFAAKCRKADVLIHEATLAGEASGLGETLHSTASEAAEIALKARVKLLVITHFSPRYRDLEELAREAKRIFPRVIVARKGLSLTVWFHTPRVIQVSSQLSFHQQGSVSSATGTP